MKYTKIRGIDLATCTAEQMQAYNIAFRIYINNSDDLLILPTYSRVDAEKRLIYRYINQLKQEQTNSRRKSNYDAIFSILNMHLDKYLHKHFIAGSYKEVGEGFPLVYDIYNN